MTTAHPTAVTEVLRRIRDGDAGGVRALVAVVYNDLKRMAAGELRGERTGGSPSSLIHETFERLVGNSNMAWEDRAHFFAVAAREMRRVLIDRARTAGALKRGGGRRRVSLADADQGADDMTIELLAVAEAVEMLGRRNRRHQQVAELRLFGEMTCKEIGHVLGYSEETVKKDWRFVRAWLRRALAGGED